MTTALRKIKRAEEARRRVEQALPAAIAFQIIPCFMADDEQDAEYLRAAKIVFNEVILEPVAHLPLIARESHIRHTVALADAVLERAVKERAGVVTVYAAMHHWLQPLLDAGKLTLNPESMFIQAWEAIGAAFAKEEENLDDWAACQRSARKMAARWADTLATKGYFR